MPAITIKDVLIECVKAFNGVPQDKQSLIDHTLKEIEEAAITNDEQGKQFAGGMVNLLGELVPQLKANEENNILVKKLEQRINQAIAFELASVSRRPRNQGG